MNSTRTWSIIGLLATMVMIMTGCRDDFPPSPGNPTTEPLRNIPWRLVSYQTIGGTVVNVATQKATIGFGDSTNMSGYTGCNQFGGECLIDTATGAMTLRNIWATKRWCGDNSIEPMYMNALEKMTSYKLTATTLHLYSTNDSVAVLNYVRDSVLIPPPPPPTNNRGIFFNQTPAGANPTTTLEPIYDVMGTNDRGLTLTRFDQDALLSGPPRGGRIAYLLAKNNAFSIISAKTDGSDRKVVMQDSGVYLIDPTSIIVSPDGMLISIAAMNSLTLPPFVRYSVMILDLNGNIIDIFGIEEPGTTPVFSPDSRKIAFYGFNNTIEVAVIGSGTTATVATNAYPFTYGTGASAPNAVYGRGGLDWSPDGRYISYVGLRGSGNERDIFIVNPIGAQGPINVTNDAADDFWPVWSPDGTSIAFSSIFVTGIYQVAMTQIDPVTGTWSSKKKISPNRLIAVVLHDLFPQWSPDGKEVMYTSFLTLPEFQQGGILEVVDIATQTPSTIASGVYKGFWER